MKMNTLSIVINKPVADVFAFTVDPANTPRWIDGIVEEVTDNPPQPWHDLPKQGSERGLG